MMRQFFKLRLPWALSLLLTAAVVLTGCWDRREVNDTAIVSGMAVDKTEDGNYRLAVQFPLAGQLGGPGGGGGGTSGAKSWYLDSASGSSLKEADANLQRSLSRQLYYAHRRVLIFGEQLAREGISSHLDITIRTSQNRLSAMVVFAKGEAIDVLNANTVMEQQPSEMLRELTINSIREPRTIKHLVNKLVTEGLDVAAPYFAATETQGGQKAKSKPRISVEGLAVFKGDRLVGFLKGENATGVLWAMNQAKRPSLSVKSPEGNGRITIQFSETSRELVPVVNGDEISMKIKLRGTGIVYENQSGYKASSDNLSAVSTLATEKLKNQVQKSIKVIQGYKSDVCGFGDTLHRKKPKVWKQVRENWYDLYADMKVEVEADLQLEHAGTTVEPAAKSEELLNQ